MKYLSSIFIILTLTYSSFSQMSSAEVIDKAIQYHDSKNQWPTLKTTLKFDEKRPDGSVRKTFFEMDNSTGSYKLNRGDQEIHGMKMDSCFIEMGDADCQRAEMLRNYYLYLWGLPMKLKDQGTTPDAEVITETYENTPSYVVRVEYEKDTWYFYFDQSNFRMLGYKFYQDEAETKGEWIKIKDEIDIAGIKIPKSRSWYTLPEMKFLGEDVLTGIK